MTREEAHKAALDAKAHWDGGSSESWLIGCLVAIGVLNLDEPQSTKRVSEQHNLKVWPEYFDAILRGDKNFEIRKDDRGFREQDVLLLREYSPGPDEYTGREITARVTYCIRGNEPMGHAFGLRTGFVAMALAIPSEERGCK